MKLEKAQLENQLLNQEIEQLKVDTKKLDQVIVTLKADFEKSVRGKFEFKYIHRNSKLTILFSISQ